MVLIFNDKSMPIKPEKNPKTNFAIQRIGNKSELRSLNDHTIVVSSVALKIILIAQTNVQEIQHVLF